MQDTTLKLIIDAVDKTGNVLKRVEGKVNNVGEKMKGMGTKMMAMGVAMSGAMLIAFDKIDAGMDAVAIGTGATGVKLEGLQDIVRNIAKTTPADFETIGKAVGEVNTRLGFTGKTNEEVSRKFVDMSRLLGTDVTETIRNVSRSMLDAGVKTEDMSLYLDKLMRISQLTGVNINGLTDLMTTYGVQMRGVGLSADDSRMLLAKWEKEGVSITKMLPGLSMAMGKLARAGKDPAKAFWELTDTIKKAKTQGEAIKIAMDLLGAKAGPDFALAVREGRFELGNMGKDLDKSAGTIQKTADATDDWREKLEIAKNKALIALEPVLVKFADILAKKIVPFLEKIINKVSLWIKKNPELAEKIGTLVPIFLIVAGAVMMIVGAIMTCISVVALLVGIIAGAVVVIIASFKGAWNTIKLTFGTLVINLKTKILSIKLFFMNLRDSISNIWTSIKNTARNKIDGIVSFFRNLPSRIYSALSGFVSKVATYLRIKFPKIKLPHFEIKFLPAGGLIGKALNKLGLPGKPSINVKWYQEGGIFNKPSVIGVGESGPEAVVPLKSGGVGNTINIMVKDNTFVNMDELVDRVDKELMNKLRRNLKVVSQF